MARSVVDLPAPLAPMRVTISPSLHGEGDALEGFDAAVADFQIRYFAAGSFLIHPQICL